MALYLKNYSLTIKSPALMRFFIISRNLYFRYRKYKLVSKVDKKMIISFRLFYYININQRLLKSSFVFW